MSVNSASLAPVSLAPVLQSASGLTEVPKKTKESCCKSFGKRLCAIFSNSREQQQPSSAVVASGPSAEERERANKEHAERIGSKVIAAGGKWGEIGRLTIRKKTKDAAGVLSRAEPSTIVQLQAPDAAVQHSFITGTVTLKAPARDSTDTLNATTVDRTNLLIEPTLPSIFSPVTDAEESKKPKQT
jgi:hypothetical protein